MGLMGFFLLVGRPVGLGMMLRSGVPLLTAQHWHGVGYRNGFSMEIRFVDTAIAVGYLPEAISISSGFHFVTVTALWGGGFSFFCNLSGIDCVLPVKMKLCRMKTI